MVAAGGSPGGKVFHERNTRVRFAGLTKAERRTLTRLGFVTNVEDAEFANNIKLLKAFAAQNGHVRVPRSEKAGDLNTLGNWLKHCQRKARKGNLSATEHAELTACGVVLPPLPDNENQTTFPTPVPS